MPWFELPYGEDRMLARPLTVTVSALTTMLHSCGLGVAHPVIEVEPIFTDTEGDQRAQDAMRAEFRRLGMVDHQGRWDADMLDTLAVVARPSVEYFGWFNIDGGSTFGVLVAALGEQAVVVVRGPAKVRLTAIRNHSLPETLVRQLPVVPAARIEAVNIRQGEIETTAADDGRTVLVDARPGARDDLAAVRALTAEQAVGLGELYVAVRDGRGLRVSSREPIRYRDSQRGRVLITVADDYLSIAPATPVLLAARLRGAHMALSADAR
jgi:hypothetical protein